MDKTQHRPVGSVRFGDLRRTSPISSNFGVDRGVPLDRYYIEGFLIRNAGDVHGRVLEVATNGYTKRFGGERVTRSDVVSVVEGDPIVLQNPAAFCSWSGFEYWSACGVLR
jgi:hypothetical protein